MGNERTFEPGPEAFMIRLCWNEMDYLTLIPQFALRYRILTFNTSAGEQTVVATVPFTIKYQHAFTFPLFQQKRTEEKHTAAKLAVK